MRTADCVCRPKRMRGRLLRGAAGAALAVSLVTACASMVEVDSAEVSIDGLRIAVTFNSCGVVTSASAEETAESVVIWARPSTEVKGLSGQDCQDRVVVQLHEPLGDREVIDGATERSVTVSGPTPESEIAWPYDRSRFTEADYEAALEEMVRCLESEDPKIDAWVVDELNMQIWDFHKEPDDDGYLDIPAIDICEERILAPLE